MPTGQQGKLLPLSACTMHWVSCAIRATGVPRVPRRQREDQAHMQEVYPGWSVGDTWEQPFWNQVLSSVTAGKPYHTVHEKTPKEWEAEIGKGYMHNSQEALPIAWPPEWRNLTGLAPGQTGNLHAIHNLTLPVVDPGWWEPRRKYFYGPAGGNVSAQFMELIRTSTPEPFYELGGPWEAMELPAESFAYLPCWFSCGWALAAPGRAAAWERMPPLGTAALPAACHAPSTPCRRRPAVQLRVWRGERPVGHQTASSRHCA
jgi:hypothetical protein